MSTRRDQRSFADRLRAALADTTESDPAVAVIRKYMRGFDGAAFNTYAADPRNAHRITPADLVAVTFLSMEIRRGSTSGFTPKMSRGIETNADRISELLILIPPDRELHTVTADDYESWLGEGSHADRLWRLLRDELNLPRVATYKLLARKRPHLLPIRDSAADRALGKPDSWWHSWWEALTTSADVVNRLECLRRDSGHAELSLLRTADIVVWMRYRPTGDAKSTGM